MENQVAICWSCHTEWHLIEERIPITFAQWLMIPPINFVHYLASEYFCDEPADVNGFGTFARIWNNKRKEEIER
jgi:hypothetical protein